MSGKCTVEQQKSDIVAEKTEAAHADESHDTTIFYSSKDRPFYSILVPQCIVFGDDGEEQHCHGTG